MGGSAGGGGSESAASFREIAENMLAGGFTGETPEDLVIMSVVEAMNAALSAGGNPYENHVAYDATQNILAMRSTLDEYKTTVTKFDPSWVFESPAIDKAEQVFTEKQLTRFNRVLLPTLQKTYRNAGAVTSSYHAIAQGILLDEMNKEINSFVAQLLLQSYQAHLSWRLQSHDALVRYGLEIERMAVAAGVDQISHNVTLDMKRATWNLETFAYGGNLLAATHGASVVYNREGTSKFQSALSGALTGGSFGAMSGVPQLAAAGAIVGALGGIL